MKNVLKVKNLQRAGKVTVDTTYGDIEIEVYKQKGGSIFYVKIDGVDKGINRAFAEDCWKWCAEYLGLTLDSEIKSAKVAPTETKTKRSQSKWRN